MNWGDGSAGLFTLNQSTFSHAYTVPGTYQVQYNSIQLSPNTSIPGSFQASETVVVVSASTLQAITSSTLSLDSQGAASWGADTGNQPGTLLLAGPVGLNPYISGNSTNTPEIPGADTNLSNTGLQYGSDLFGLLNTTATQLGASTNKSDAEVWTAINDAPATALVAVIREHAPSGMPNYANDDVLLFVNLTSVALEGPELGLSLGNTSTLEEALMNGGVNTNASTGGTLTDVTIAGLPAGSVWATLVPANSGNLFVNASLAGGQTQSISGAALASGGILYININTPTTTVGASIPGLQAVASSPVGQNLYGINTAQNLLVVASTATLTQQQSFQDGVAQAPTGTQKVGTTVKMPDPVAVAVSPDGMNVYVASGNDNQIAIFSRGASGDLVFQGSRSSSGIVSLTSLAVFGSNAGSDELFVGGANGVAKFQGDTTKNTLTSPKDNTTLGSVSSISVSSDGQVVFATVPSENAIDVLSTSALSLVGQPSTTTLDGASSVANSGNTVELVTLDKTTLVSGLASTAGLFVGEQVSGSGIPAGTTIALINSSSSLTLSQAETSDLAASLTFFGDGPALEGTLNGTTSVTQLPTTAGLFVGEPISAADIPFGTTIVEIDTPSSITLSQQATASGVELVTPIDDYAILSGTLSGSSVTNLASTASLYVGEPVSGYGILAGTTIAQVSIPNSITLSKAATSAGSESLTFFSDIRSMAGTLNSSTEVTKLSTTLGLIEGEEVTGAGIPAGTIIAEIDSSTSIVLSQQATTSGPTTLSFVTNDTTQTANTNGTTLVTGLARTAGFFDGELVTGAGIPAGTTIAQVNSATSLTLSQAATTSGPTVLIFPQPFDSRNYVYVAGQSSNTLAVFARNPATNTLSLLQTLEDGVDGVRGLGDPTGLAVTPDSQYLYVTSGSEHSLAVFGTGPNGSVQVDQVEIGAVGLTAPSGLAVGGTSDNAYVASSSGIGAGNGGLASFIALASTTPSSLLLSYSNMQTLELSLGNAPNTITEINHATTGPASTNPGPATLVIVPGTGANTINLLDPAGTTVVDATGSGGNRIAASVTAPNALLIIIAGDGTNNVELDAAASGDQVVIQLGNGNSTAQIEGTSLDPNATVSVAGGTGKDTLFFDRQTDSLVFYGPGLIPATQLMLPDGAIQAQGFGLTEYSSINNLTGFSGPTVNPDGSYVISQGTQLILHGRATGTNIQAGWDFDGDNNFTDAVGLDTSVSWATLVSLGLNLPGTYPIGLQVESDTGTVTGYTTVTIVAARPSVSFSLTGNATIGVPYMINNFKATEPAGATYGVTGWAVNWGDGTPSDPDIETLSSQSTSATHTYTAVGTNQITLSASDPYYFNGETALTGTLYPGGIVTGLSSTASLYEKEAVSGAGIPAGATISHIISGSEIAIPANVSSSEPVTLTFTSTATSASQNVGIGYGDGSVSAGGPYTISSGSELTLQATAAGNVPASDFYWDLVGTTGSSFVQFPGAMTSFSNGFTTYTNTVDWTDLGIDEGSYDNVRVEVKYPAVPGIPAFNAISSPKTLTVSDTAPTAVIATQTNADGSITISFTNQVDPSASQTNDGFTYSYDFDDNGTFSHDGVSYANLTAASQNVPTDMLAQPGSFVVRLRITAQDTTFTDYNTIVTVAAVAPTVTIGSNQSQIASPGTPFVLNDVTFTDPFYATASAPWKFTAPIDWGDGTTSQGVITVTQQGNAGNPAEGIPPVPTMGSISASHLYAPGVTPPSAVEVHVRDSDGNVGTAGFPITFTPPAVAITLVSEQTVAIGAVFIPSQVYFTDSAAPGMSKVSIDWGDGTGITSVPYNDIVEPATPTDHGTIGLGYTYGFPGQYNVTMTVTDQYKASKVLTFPVNVVDVAPTVIAGSNISQSPGVPVGITANFSSPSFKTNGKEETYSYTIEWGDGQISSGSVSDTARSDGQPTTGSISGTHTYSSHGNYTATVTVTDSEGNQGSDSLLVDDIPPAVTISPYQVQTVNQGSPLVVAANFTDPGFESGATAANYPATIDWGDGQTSQGTVQITQAGGPGVPTLGTVTGNHFYADDGMYPVTVFVADLGGGVGQATFNASVNFTTPTLAPLAGGVYVPHQLLTVTDTFTEPGIAPNDFVTVNWGDGTTYSFDSSSYYVNSSEVHVPYLVEPTATNPGMITVGHTYTGSGPELVTFTVTDKDGISDTVSAIYTEGLGVASITAVAPNPRNTPVSDIQVTLTEPATFSVLALTLTDNGGPNLITNVVSINLVSGSTYQINGLAGLTTAEGNYTLTVNAAAFKDSGGASGIGSLSTSWLMDTTTPTSKVSPLRPRESALSFSVAVTGTDPGATPSGVASYEIYVSTNGIAWTLWTTVPASNPTATFTGQSNTTYSFYSIAQDKAGNTEVKKPLIEASTYVPDFTPPVTAVDATTGANPSTVNSSTGTFTLLVSGSDTGGSGLAYVEVFVEIDGHPAQEIGTAIPAGPPNQAGNVVTPVIYQGPTDGASHTYQFFSIGIDGAGNVQATPATPNLTLSETFAQPAALVVTGLTVEHGAVERSYVRYLDIAFNESDGQSGGVLSQIVASATSTSPEIQLFKYDLAGDASSKVAVPLTSPTILDVVDHAIEIDFGSGGIGGNSSSTAGDGYYELDIRLPNGQTSVHHFYRMLGDVSGDGVVDQDDLNEIAAEIGESAPAGWTPLNADVTGGGTVSALDLTLATRSKGHKLGTGLSLG